MKHRAYRRVGVLFLIASMRIASTTAQIQYSVTTIAGVPGKPGQNNGQAQQALFDQPSDLAVASNGQIWVVDQQDRVLRRIFPDGRVTSFAQVAPNVTVTGLEADFDGNIYFAQTSDRGFSNIIRINADGVLEFVTSGVSGVLDLTIVPGGDLYAMGMLSDERVIWRVLDDGDTEIVARGIDGLGLSADRSNHLYVTCCEREFFAPRGFIERFAPSGESLRFAGEGPTGACDGPGTKATFRDPAKLVTSFGGVVFVADSGNHTIREIRPLLTEEAQVLTEVRTLAGRPEEAGFQDGPGPLARFNRPRGITLDSVGNLLVADTGNHVIRKLAQVEDDTTLYVAQFGGGAGLQTELVLTNPSEVNTVSSHIRFRDDAGRPLVVSAAILPDPAEPVVPAGFENVSGFEVSIPPLGGTVLVTDPDSALRVGSATIQVDGPIGVLGRFSISGIGTAGVQASAASGGFVSPARFGADGSRSALAFHNPEEHPLTLRLSLRSNAGEPVANGVLEIPARGHRARFLEELFEGLILESFDGILQARSESGGVVAVALEFGTGAGQLSSVPVTPLAVRLGR